MKIPKKFRVGGQLIEVETPEKIEDSKLGDVCVARGTLRIAQNFDGDKQSESSKENTFVHELLHAILDTMGKGELSRDETFVSTFAGFLLEAIHSMEEDWRELAIYNRSE